MTTSAINYADYTILVVDDNETNLRVIVEYLRGFGFKLLMAMNGQLCLKIAQARRPDIILLDVMMPELDGFETCERLKATEVTRDIPVIFMTALTSEDDKVRGFEVGAVDYVTKPIQQREVLARVNTHLQLLHFLRQEQHRRAEEQRQREIAVSLRQVSKVLNSTLNQAQLLQIIMEQLGRVVPFDGAAIFLHENQRLILSQGIGFGATYMGNSVLLTDKSSGVMVFNSQKPMLIMDTKHDARWQAWTETNPILSWMGAPLVLEDEAIGVLTVDSFTTHKYNEADVSILQIFANHAAVAIRNARLYSLVQQVNEQLIKLNADKDKFFSIVAHDLKGPFLPLLGNLELMQEMALTLKPTDVEAMSAASYRSAKRVFELLENLLCWARLQMGRMEYDPQRVNLSEIVTKTVELLADNAKVKQINLDNQVQPETWVYADNYMLDTVIRNLSSNALKFTPQGGQVTISAHSLSEETPGRFVEVSIADTGVGLPPQVKEKLFKIDQYVTTIGTNKETGTGLGLIICQEMVVKSGGRIWVESEVGQGTTVHFMVRLDEVS